MSLMLFSFLLNQSLLLGGHDLLDSLVSELFLLHVIILDLSEDHIDVLSLGEGSPVLFLVEVY